MEVTNYPMFTADIARETKRSLRFIYREIKKGHIPGVIKIGDMYAISRKNYEAWINGESTDCQTE